jgi:very-long-chain enoyl-CoA reductase
LETTTVGDLKRKFFASINRPSLDVNRYKFVIESTGENLGPNERALSAFESLKSASAKSASEFTILYKDLGPQISWRTVFIVEYFFPMIAFPLLWFIVRKVPGSYLTQLVYPGTSSAASVSTSQYQDILAIMFTVHFLKREIETILIHRFGNDTMPLTNIFKNSGYYWLFAYWIAYVTMHPLYTPPACNWSKTSGIILFCVSELLNLKAHVDLRNLRPAGTRIRQVPKTLLFKFVSCPNYLFEILSWIGFTIASQSIAAATFTIVGAAQMTVWAIAKHKRYRKEFDGQDGRELYPKNRKILIPFIF